MSNPFVGDGQDNKRNVRQGVITEVGIHIGVRSAPKTPRLGDLVPGHFNEGNVFMYHHSIGGAFNNLRLMKKCMEVERLDLMKFLKRARHLNLIGGSGDTQNSQQLKTMMVEGKAPCHNKSRWTAPATHMMYSVWFDPDDAKYKELFDPSCVGNNDFMAPLTISGKHLTESGIVQHVQKVIMEEVWKKVSMPLPLGGTNQFAINTMFTQTAADYNAVVSNTTNPAYSHPLYLNPAEVNKYLRDYKNNYSFFDKLCFLYLQASGAYELYQAFQTQENLVAGIAAVAIAGANAPAQLVNFVNSVQAGPGNTRFNLKYSDFNFGQGTNTNEPTAVRSVITALSNAAAPGAVTLPGRPGAPGTFNAAAAGTWLDLAPYIQTQRRDRVDKMIMFHNELSTLVNMFIYPIGFALVEIPSGQVGTLQVLMRAS